MKDETPTRVWVNNPTMEEVRLALAQGAVGCTTNPGYGANLLNREPESVNAAIDAAVANHSDDAEAAEAVQLALVARIVDAFRPMHEASLGSAGFVSSQGAPDADRESDHILAEAQRARALGPNATPKIPATGPGLDAFETLVGQGSPTIVTEVFSLAQLVDANERYLAVSKRTGLRPPFFMSPITGIFADHLRALAARELIEADAKEVSTVGVILTRACYETCRDRDYPVTLLAGGARIPFDLTGLVGERIHATINWSTFAEILAREHDPTESYADKIDPGVVDRLRRSFPEVDQALDLDGLHVEDFEAFGPVQYFRSIFLDGWQKIRQAIAERRAAPVAGV